MTGAIRWLVLLIAVSISSAWPACPGQCNCGLDALGRIETICDRGRMRKIPLESLDLNVEVLIIRGPNNELNIGPIFGKLKKLEVLRITDSDIPSVGHHSFWGVPSLRYLGESVQLIALKFIGWWNIDCRFVPKQDCATAGSQFQGSIRYARARFVAQQNTRDDELGFSPFEGESTRCRCHPLSNRTHTIDVIQLHSQDLKRLNLAHNKIGTLVPRVFYQLNRLKYLDLSGNPLSKLPPDVFNDISVRVHFSGWKCFSQTVSLTHDLCRSIAGIEGAEMPRV